jgi:Transcriptional Coactivator p15 (PC4)
MSSTEFGKFGQLDGYAVSGSSPPGEAKPARRSRRGEGMKEVEPESVTTPVASVQLPGNREIRTALVAYRGEESIDIRVWYGNRDGSCRPGRGVRFPKRNLAAMRDALDAAIRAVDAQALTDLNRESR